MGEVQIDEDRALGQVVDAVLRGPVVIGHNDPHAPRIGRPLHHAGISGHHALQQRVVEVGDDLGRRLTPPGQATGQHHRAVRVDHGNEADVVPGGLQRQVGCQGGLRAQRSPFRAARDLRS